jgi:hypothetical protein
LSTVLSVPSQTDCLLRIVLIKRGEEGQGERVGSLYGIGFPCRTIPESVKIKVGNGEGERDKKGEKE